MSFSARDVEISARILVRRYGAGALRRAEAQVHRLQRMRAFEAANTWRQLATAIRGLKKSSEKRAQPASRKTTPVV